MEERSLLSLSTRRLDALEAATLPQHRTALREQHLPALSVGMLDRYAQHAEIRQSSCTGTARASILMTCTLMWQAQLWQAQQWLSQVTRTVHSNCVRWL